MLSLTLNNDWQFKQRDPQSKLEADFITTQKWLQASVPGSVHQDLLAAGRIPDPFVGLNENAVQWVGECDWLYRSEFNLPPEWAAQPAIWLCFEGLDTFATVWLNGKQILISDNMFVPHRLEVSKLLQPGQNELRLLFQSASRCGKEREAQYGKRELWNGDSSRLYVRKAQYHYGWDWGPTLLTAGIWRTVRLEAGAARIAEMACPIEVPEDLSLALLPVRAIIETVADAETTLRLELYGPDGNFVSKARVEVKAGEAQHTFELDAPQLWWPRSYGAQALYRLVAILETTAEGAELDQQEQRLGLRRLRLVQEPLTTEPGTTFMFEVNNTPIFCGGYNWIPADVFTPRIEIDRYRHWLQLAADGNAAMLRVWGGGIYEEDVFYDTCDELGLLVWQDFMFACGMYPALDWFQTSVQAEAEAAVRRLRHHPCLALWCGNNEDYSIAHSLGRYDAEYMGDLAHSPFPARAIYEQLLPEVCARLDHTRPYWPGSPYGGPGGSSQIVGDRHTWDVWHSEMADYHAYKSYAGRFVSEFGMEALPTLTMLQTIAPPVELYPGSRTLEHHNKSADGYRRLAVYLGDNLRPVSNLEDYIYATQFIQAEALTNAIRSWRKRWGGPGRYAVAGALVWQLNDCWPVTSWAVADYNLQPKPAYYALRRELAPVTVGFENLGNGQAALWCVNGYTHAIEAEVCVRGWTLEGKQTLEECRQVILKPNQTNLLDSLPFQPEQGIVLSATLLEKGTGAVLARSTLWPEPFKYFSLPDPEITLVRLDDTRLQVQATRPAKGVWLTTNLPLETKWSNNMLDILPGEPQIIAVERLGKAEVKMQTAHTILGQRV